MEKKVRRNVIKKIIVTLLCCVILFLAGCGGSSRSAPVGVSNTPAKPQNTPESVSTPEPQSTPDSPSVPAPETFTGDIIEFGGYTWRVLDKQDGRALILIENLIEDKTYHNEWDEVTWETSDIRAWLNNEFYNSFSEAERARIQETVLINNDNPRFYISGGNDTVDKIFFLSLEEVEQYFDNDDSRIARDANGYMAWWWLRTPGVSKLSASYVNSDGSLNDSGARVDWDGYGVGGVRPALWLLP